MAELLLVDDDADLAELMRILLEERGHRVSVAGTCAEARDKLRDCCFELLIVDGALPDGLGTDFLRELRNMAKPPNAMFVSVSSREVTAVVSNAVKLGVSRVLRKPLDPATLPLEVACALRREGPVERTAQVGALLEQASVHFHSKLAGRVSALETALRDARDKADLPLLGPVHAEAHRLHGTAGSFGYDEIGVSAGVIEALLADALRTHTMLDDDTWQRVLAAQGRMERALSTTPRSSTAPPAASCPSTLLVDNDAMLLRSLASELSSSLEVLTASSPTRALETARAAHPNCIVIDVHLGENMLGIELAKALRSQRGTQNIPIVFMSADSSLDTQIAGLHAGGSLFLSKPVSPGSLVEAVRRVTEGRSTRRPRVVLMDDDLGFSAAVQRVLRRAGFDLTTVQDEALLLDTLSSEDPALLLLDVQLGGIGGLDICRTLRANPRWENLDIVLLTADTAPEMRVAAFRAGVSDYLAKPIESEELVARIMSRIERHALRDERATRDNLTGLTMRGPFSEALERILKLAQRNRTPVSLCLLDLDRFKSINDRYGHMSGDRVLSTLGQLLNTRFRGEDLRCRWGGEEIVLALAGSPAAEAKLAVERLLAEFQSLSFDGGRHTQYHVTFSAGIASFPEDGRTVDELVAIADTRMYTSKREGRARVTAH